MNIDWKAEGFAQKAQEQLAKDRPVMVYCRSGRRSAEASAVLEELGFKTFNLLDGIKAWIEAGNVNVKVSTPLSPSSQPTLQ